MWLKNDGLILVELLMSLSVLLMICLFFTPLVIDLNKQSKQVQIEKQAVQILYEELQNMVNSGQPPADHVTIHNGIEYQITSADTEKAGQKEVCVKVEKNSFLPGTKVCGLSE